MQSPKLQTQIPSSLRNAGVEVPLSPAPSFLTYRHIPAMMHTLSDAHVRYVPLFVTFGLK